MTARKTAPRKAAAKKAAARKRPARKKAAATTKSPQELQPRSPRVAAFPAEYLRTLNGAEAARNVGFSAAGSRRRATELLKDPWVVQELARLSAERMKRLEIETDDIVRHWWTVGTADPRELVEFRRESCRHCHGEGHRFQRTAAEMERDRESHELMVQMAKAAPRQGKKKAPLPGPFDEKGGIGFDPRRAPHPDCPECWGDGIGRTIVRDTRHLSPAAALLYAGVKETQHGIEVKMRNQDDAILNVAKHLGMFIERHEHSADESLAELMAQAFQRGGSGAA